MSKLKLALLLCSMTVFGVPANAYDGNLTIKNGSGEEFTYKNGMFGTKKVLVKDRIGNKYEKKKGLFGSRSKEVSVLGNQYKSKHGILGDKAEGRSFFGDSVTVKKSAFGRTSTEVDLSGIAGIAGVVKDMMTEKEPFADAPSNISSDDLINAYKGQSAMPVHPDEQELKSPGARLLELQTGL